MGSLGAMLAKELRLRMRTWRSVLTITLYLASLVAIGLGTMIYLRNQGKNTGLEAASIGPQVFGALAEFQVLLLLFVTPALTASAIAGEKERQTYDLLLTTRLTAFSIITGKLVMSLAYVFLLLFMSLPLFALAFLFGGVSPQQLLLTMLVLAMTALTVGSISLLVSTLIRKVQVATVVAYVLSFGLVLGSGIFASTLVPASPNSNNSFNSYFSPPANPSPLAYLSPVAALSTIVTNPFGAAVQIPFLQLPNGLPEEYFNRSFSQTSYPRSVSNQSSYVPGSFYSLPAIWPIQLGLYGGLSLLSLALAVRLVRPHHRRSRSPRSTRSALG